MFLRQHDILCQLFRFTYYRSLDQVILRILFLCILFSFSAILQFLKMYITLRNFRDYYYFLHIKEIVIARGKTSNLLHL